MGLKSKSPSRVGEAVCEGVGVARSKDGGSEGVAGGDELADLESSSIFCAGGGVVAWESNGASGSTSGSIKEAVSLDSGVGSWCGVLAFAGSLLRVSLGVVGSLSPGLELCLCSAGIVIWEQERM